MKRILAVALTITLGLPLFACGGGQNVNQPTIMTESGQILDRTITMADGITSFSVSSEWEERENSDYYEPGTFFVFIVDGGLMDVSYSSRDTDPYEEHEEQMNNFNEVVLNADVKDLGIWEISVNGHTVVVDEYTYMSGPSGERHNIEATFLLDGRNFEVGYTAPADGFTTSAFYAVVQSVAWK